MQFYTAINSLRMFFISPNTIWTILFLVLLFYISKLILNHVKLVRALDKINPVDRQGRLLGNIQLMHVGLKRGLVSGEALLQLIQGMMSIHPYKNYQGNTSAVRIIQLTN